MAAELCLAKECVWYDKSKYEQAETRYQEIVASRHAGLTIEVSDYRIRGMRGKPSTHTVRSLTMCPL